MRILLTPAPPPGDEEDEDDLDGLEVDVRRSGVFMTEVKDKEKRLSMGSVKVTNLDEVIQAAEVEENREEVTDTEVKCASWGNQVDCTTKLPFVCKKAKGRGKFLDLPLTNHPFF